MLGKELANGDQGGMLAIVTAESFFKWANPLSWFSRRTTRPQATAAVSSASDAGWVICATRYRPQEQASRPPCGNAT